MQPVATIPNPQYGLSRMRQGLPEGYDALPGEAKLVAATNKLNEIRFNSLTHKQRFFLDSYITHGQDGLAAAREARLVGDDEPDSAANHAAARLLRKPYMVKAVEAWFEWSAARAEIQAPELIRGLLPLATSNMADYVSKDGDIALPIHDRALMAAVKEIRVDVVRQGRGEDARYVEKISLKLYDKVDATMKLLKLMGHDGAQDQPGTQVNVQQNNTNTIAVNLQIMPVPSGQFLPAPEKPEGSMIAREPILGRLA